MKLLTPKQHMMAYEFLLENRAAALATVDAKGVPHVVTVYSIPHKDLTLYFTTKAEGRKFNNLTKNPTVAMAITHDDGPNLATIQLTGIAERVEDLKEEQAILLDLWRMRYDEASWPPPPMRLYERGAADELAVMRVTPTEMTFADFKTTATKRYRPFFEEIIKAK